MTTIDPGKLLDLLLSYLPPAFGAFVGLRYAGESTPRQRVAAFLTSFVLAIYLGPAIAEVLSLGPKSTVAVGILVAIVGTEVIGGLVVAAAAFHADPFGTVKRWLGRGP